MSAIPTMLADERNKCTRAKIFRFVTAVDACDAHQVLPPLVFADRYNEFSADL